MYIEVHHREKALGGYVGRDATGADLKQTGRQHQEKAGQGDNRKGPVAFPLDELIDMEANQVTATQEEREYGYDIKEQREVFPETFQRWAKERDNRQEADEDGYGKRYFSSHKLSLV